MTAFTQVCLMTLIAALPGISAAERGDPAKSESLTESVSLASVDLATPSGAAEARKRLLEVSRHLCQKFWDGRKSSNWETYVDCTRDTLNAALAKLDQ